MESHIEYLRAKILWQHLQDLSVTSDDVSREICDRLTCASAVSLLSGCEDTPDGPIHSIGGLTSNDIARYGEQRGKLSQEATAALAESLDTTLKDVLLYYHAVEELEPESHKFRLDADVQVDLIRHESDLNELSSRLSVVLDLYQEAEDIHSRLQSNLEETIRTLPPLLNANRAVSHDLLALTIETSLLKLSVVRARTRASLYGYTSSNSRATMSQAISNLHEKFTAQQQVLNTQDQDIQSRLQEYQELLELVDGHGGGFAQVVEDLATVRRETEDCRNDLRRLGWTED